VSRTRDDTARSGAAKLRRTPTTGRALCLAILAIPLAALAIGVQLASAALTAQAARTVTVKDEGRLKLVKSSGSLLIDEGPASGSLPGKVRVRFIYNGEPTVSAQIAISGPDGSLNARGSGRLSSLTSPSPSFKGTLTISGASGRYAGAHGSGELYGVFYRRTYAMTVQTNGTLHY
jgi:hypothetical protein